MTERIPTDRELHYAKQMFRRINSTTNLEYAHACARAGLGLLDGTEKVSDEPS